MYFKQIDKTTWKCVVEAPRDPVTGKRRQISRRGETKKGAEKKAIEALKEFNSQRDFDQKITFEEFSLKWFQNYANRGVKKSTLDNKKYCVNKLNSQFAKMQMKNITSLYYQNTLDELNETLSRETLKSIHNTMQQIFAYALQSGLIEKDVLKGTFVPKTAMEFSEVNEVENLYFNKKELRAFLGVLDVYQGIVIQTILYLLTFTGMRPGEAIILKHSDIDWEENTININKTAYRNNRLKGGFIITPPKSKSATRIIDVDPLVMDMLKKLAAHQKLLYPSSDFVFGMNDGLPPTVEYLRTVVGRLAKKANIKKNATTYMLRHTHISLLAEAEVDLNYIMARVGHKNATTTTQIYTHVTSGMRKKSMKKLHNKFTEILKLDEN